MQLEGDLFVHVVHIAGTRMIEEGANGLSKGREHLQRHDDRGEYTVLHHIAQERK
jgi:hypothetical protein